MRDDRIVFLVTVVSLAAIITMWLVANAAIHEACRPTMVVEGYATYTAELPTPRLAGRPAAVIEYPVKVRLVIWKNGKVVVNKTDPATLNLASLVNAMLGSRGFWFAGIHLNPCAHNGNLLLTGKGAWIVVSNETITWPATADINSLSGTTVSSQVSVVYQLNNTVVLVAGFIFTQSMTIRSVGLTLSLYDGFYTATGLIAADNVTAVNVAPGDNVTVAYYISMPSERLASMLYALMHGGSIAMCTNNPTNGPYLTAVTANGTSVEIPLRCYHTFTALNGTPMVLGVCVGLATQTATVKSFVYAYTARYGVGYTVHYATYSDVLVANLTQPLQVTNNTPVSAAFAIRWG